MRYYRDVKIRSYQSCESCNKPLNPGQSARTDGSSRYFCGNPECERRYDEAFARHQQVIDMARSVHQTASDFVSYNTEKIYWSAAFTQTGGLGCWTLHHRDPDVMLKVAEAMKSAMDQFVAEHSDCFGPERTESGIFAPQVNQAQAGGQP